MKELKVVESEALQLAAEDRARLAESLLLSLDSPTEEEAEAAWAEEASRRADELDRGEVKPVSSVEVMRKARELRGEL
ncbi:addiction module protein [Candidatus Sumerlaeota bacterium]|nr:addiction module protein [Candidatus Sumerlaeota bacterium]